MKPSKWNLEMNVDDDFILFNQITQAILKVEPEKEEKVKEIIHSQKIESSNDEDVLTLKRGGYIIEDDFDETDHLKSKFNNYKYTDEFLRFTIVMTTACNFACTYCYQNQIIPIMRNESSQNISYNMIDDILKVTKNYFESKKPRTLSVTFYGGEPLLEFEKMIKLSDEFQKLCKEYDVFYDPFVVTNGYNLTKERAKRLSEVGIKSVIITVDGQKDLHDKYRPLKSGNGTYNTLVKNIQDVQDVIHVQIRTNISKDSVLSVKEMIKEFVQRKLKVTFDFQMVEIVPGTPNSFKDQTLTLEEFADVEVRLYEEVLKYFPKYPFNPFKKVRFARCDALCQNSLVVDTDGHLFKCWGEVGSSNKNVGKIHDGKIKLNHRLERWTSWSPFENERCKNCEILPLCMGGCVFNEIVVDKFHALAVKKPQSTCIPLKYNLKEMIKLVVKNEMKKRRKEVNI